MKKRLLIFITVLAVALFSSFAVVACAGEDDGPKAEYSVTVLGADGQPAGGITVSWKQSGKVKGSAKTNDDGVASAKLPSGTYSVTLSGFAAGLTYTEISVTSAMREITLSLEITQVVYTATVLDKSGAAANGVTVTWTNEKGEGDSAVTVDGKAEVTLDYGDYTVTVSNLPDGNVFTDNVTATGANPNSVIELRGGQTVDYKVNVRSEGGLKFKGTTVFVYNSESVPVYSGKTDDNGEMAFSLQAGSYTASLPGSSVQEGYTVTKTAALTSGVRQGEIVLSSAVIDAPAASDKVYKIGDIINDFTFTTPYEVNGSKESYTISELLETKDAVIINNWGTNCSYCVQEMPAMDEMYKKLNGSIELLAISNYMGGDSESAIVKYREANSYSFPMMRDTNNFTAHFNLSNWPTTIVVDRYGAIAHIEVGGIPEEEIWERFVNRFIGEDYVQTFTPGADSSESARTEASKPDITLPDDHYQKVAETVNKFTPAADMDIVWSGETENDMIWPFVLGTEEGVSDSNVLCASSSKKPNSMAAIYASVKMPVGKMLVFDYYSETEADYDVFSVVWDGKIIKQISGFSHGWKTCYLYSELTAGEHMLAFAYIKDATTDTGKDNIYIKDVRFAELSALEGSVDMLRGAAYGVPAAGDIMFPHYAGVELKSDGYYHVKLNSLQNSEYAGVDSSPMLFANMTGVTNWANEFSINELVNAADETTGEYIVDCRLTVNGETRDYRNDLMEYCRIATFSDVEGFLPVDKELHDLLVAFIAKASGDNNHANMWLEVCYFYSHYGDGEFIGNPIIGLTEKTAIPVDVNDVTNADITRVMAPFPSVIYTFTPGESAVYKIESLLSKDSGHGAQAWLYDDETTSEQPLAFDGDDRFIRDRQNEQNFTIYRYMNAGHKYYVKLAFLMEEGTQISGKMDFKITNVGQTATELVPTAAGFFTFRLDENGDIITDKDGNPFLELSGTVEYELDEEGYYHAKNSDGTRGGYIYLDVKYETRNTSALSEWVNQKWRDPDDNSELDYDVFDFRYMVAYYAWLDEEGYEVVDYDPKFDLTKYGPDGRDFADYTAIMKKYVASAEDGLIKVDEPLMKILQLFIETRVNMLYDSDYDGIPEYEEALENEWLRFCWYYRVHDVNNP